MQYENICYKTCCSMKQLLQRAITGLCSYQKSKTIYPAIFFLLKTYLSRRDSSNTNLLMGLSGYETYLTATKLAQPGLLRTPQPGTKCQVIRPHPGHTLPLLSASNLKHSQHLKYISSRETMLTNILSVGKKGTRPASFQWSVATEQGEMAVNRSIGSSAPISEGTSSQ